MNLRLTAALIINRVLDGKSLSECLDATLPSIKDARDRAFVQAVCYGVCRHYVRLDIILSELLKKPMDAKDSDVFALCLVGLYQLIDMRVPEHAAVMETVNATASLKKTWSRGFVNAILREYLRSHEAINKKISDDLEAVYSHPLWMINAIKKVWPNDWQMMMDANNAHPPFSIRVNQSHQTRDAYLKKLASENMTAEIITETDNGLVLEKAVSVEKLPGFNHGDIFVQDGASQLAAEVLEVGKGMRVLDACAAPGGKLTHLLEIEPSISVFAIEKEKSRMLQINENLARLKMTATCKCADANNLASWWDKQLFDRILLDAPCSASGVIRRHPDIKLLREPNDIKAFAKQQLQLLNSLWSTLKKDGILLYTTCSIFPEENVEVIKQFLAKHPDASEKKLAVSWGRACEIGRQILPGMHQMDGFYFAKLIKGA